MLAAAELTLFFPYIHHWPPPQHEGFITLLTSLS